MKTKHLFTSIILGLLITSCDSNPCDEGYTQVQENGATFCLPDYVVGIEKQRKLGDKFFHHLHGVVVFKDNQWFDEHGNKIFNLTN